MLRYPLKLTLNLTAFRQQVRCHYHNSLKILHIGSLEIARSFIEVDSAGNVPIIKAWGKVPNFDYDFYRLSIAVRKVAGVFHQVVFHITQNCSLIVLMFKCRDHIRIELRTGSFVDNL